MLTRSGLDLVVGRALGTVLMTVRGPIHVAGARDLVASIDDALAEQPERVVIDLTGATDLDEDAVAVLASANDRAAEADVQLQVTSRTKEILSVLSEAPFQVV